MDWFAWKKIKQKRHTFDDGQSTPLSFFPSGTNEPLFHFGNQVGQIFRIGAHDLIKFGKFARSKKHLREAELKVGVFEIQRFEKCLF